jgi:hypothetical protein
VILAEGFPPAVIPVPERPDRVGRRDVRERAGSRSVGTWRSRLRPAVPLMTGMTSALLAPSSSCAGIIAVISR